MFSTLRLHFVVIATLLWSSSLVSTQWAWDPPCHMSINTLPMPWDIAQALPHRVCYREFRGGQTDPTFKYSFQECRLSMRNKPRVEIPILDPSFRCPLLPNNLLIATWTPGPNSIRYTQNITNFNIFNISWVISSIAAANNITGQPAPTYLAWADNNPVCRDALNLTCGGRPGNRVGFLYGAMKTNMATIEPYWVAEVVYISNCVTPLCAPSNADCIVESDFSPWSACFPFNGLYIKQRSKAILSNGTGFGNVCPPLDQLTQTVNCSLEEQIRVRCEFETVVSVGSCANVCGASVRNITSYNISNTPLDICNTSAVQNSSRVITYTTDGCPVNLPCSETNPTVPTEVRCTTNGNAGYRGTSIAYIEIAFNVTLDRPRSNESLASRFIIKNLISERQIYLNTSRIVIVGSRVQFWLLASSTDMAANTGDKFTILYTPVNSTSNDSTNNLKTVSGNAFPMFQCVTEDRSPPVIADIIYWANTDEGYTYLLARFSEPVRSMEGDSMISFTGFRYSGFAANPFEEGSFTPYNSGVFFYVAPFVLPSSSTPKIWAVAGAFMDESSNANEYVFNITLNPYLEVTSVIPPLAPDSFKVYRDPDSGSVFQVFFTSLLPLRAQNLLSDDSASSFLLQIQINATGSIYTVRSSRIKYEDALTTNVETGQPIIDSTTVLTRLIVEFDLDSVLLAFNNVTGEQIAAYYGDSFTLVYNGTALPVNIPNLLPESSVFLNPNQSHPATPFLVACAASPGSRFLYLTYSMSFTEEEALVQLGNTVYEGDNGISRFVAVSSNNITAELLFPFSYSMFDTDSLVYYDATTSISNPLRFRVRISNALGPRPLVLSAVLSRQGTLAMPNRLAITYSAPISSFGVPNIVQDSIKLTWTNPLISGISVGSYSINRATITYTLTVSCYISPCTNANLGLRVSARGMFDSNGNLATTFENMTVADVTPPQISASTEILPGLVTITLNKDVSPTAAQLQASIEPTPDAVFVTPANSAICAFSELMCGGTPVTIQGLGSTFTDLNQNPTTVTEFTAACASDSGGSCSITDVEGGLALFVLLPILIALEITGLVLTSRALYFVYKTPPV